MTNPSPEHIIEAYLFSEGGSATLADLAQIAEADVTTVRESLQALQKKYTGGVVLIVTESDAALRIAPECTDVIQKAHRESLAKDIGPAALEVLGILLFRGTSSQNDIDSIRGVNSAFSLRTLRMRGLVASTQQGTTKTYSLTAEALAHLGATTPESIPNFEATKESLSAFEKKLNAAAEQVEDAEEDESTE